MPVRDLDSLLAQPGVQGRRVFVRCDLNVPIKDGTIRDTTRIDASLPSLRKLLEAGARVIVSSHLGRPKGQRNEAMSLAPVADVLAERLGCKVAFANDCVGDVAEQAAANLDDGELLLLENLRFHKGETDNDPAFAQQLAKLAEVYVNDAFGTAHRAHASTAGIVEHVSAAAAGDLLRGELAHLDRLFDPEHPFLCLLGGAKVSDKLGVLEALIERADAIAVGGAMAYTFLAAQGVDVGRSLVEPDRFDDARRMQARADEKGCRLLLPSDHVVATSPDDADGACTVSQIPDDAMGLDIGPETAARYAEQASEARTILWNGPMGMFEVAAFAGGTEAVAQAVAKSSALSVVGGGDSLAAVNQCGLGASIDHLSTGGGASLEYVQGLVLPGVAALEAAAGGNS